MHPQRKCSKGSGKIHSFEVTVDRLQILSTCQHPSQGLFPLAEPLAAEAHLLELSSPRQVQESQGAVNSLNAHKSIAPEVV